MNAMENANSPWIAAAVLAVIVVAAVCAALLWRRSERLQARLIAELPPMDQPTRMKRPPFSNIRSGLPSS